MVSSIRRLLALSALAGMLLPASVSAQSTPATPATPTPQEGQGGRGRRGGGWQGRSAQIDQGAYLGVDITDLTKERASQLNLNDTNGVEVVLVDRDSPAGKAGLQQHDVIRTFNGAPVQNSEDLRRTIRKT